MEISSKVLRRFAAGTRQIDVMPHEDGSISILIHAPAPQARLESIADTKHFMSAWLALFEGRPMSTVDAIGYTKSLSFMNDPKSKAFVDALRKVLSDKEGQRITPRILGSWLRYHARKPLGGMEIIQVGRRENVALWQVIRGGD